MGPDGRFYTNARYEPDGRFLLGDRDKDKQGIMFLSATEMAALKATQRPKQGVVGPDGLFYPSGFYQSDGSFVPGGPPHAGHPPVWGPTMDPNLSEGNGYNFPPTGFGPAWPPGVQAPYSQDQQIHDPSAYIGAQEHLYDSPDRNTHRKAEDISTQSAMATPDHYSEYHHQQHLAEPKDSENLNDIGIEEQEETNGSDYEGAGETDLSHARDLFSPWGDEDELQHLQTMVSVTPRPSEHAEGDLSENIDMNVPGQTGQEVQDLFELDDLEQDVALSRLDSKMESIGSDDETGATPDGFSESAADKNDAGTPKSSQLEISDEYANVDLRAKASVLNKQVKDAGSLESGGTEAIHARKRRESTAAYMGVVEQTDSNYRRDSSHSFDRFSQARRGSTVPGTERRGSKAVPIKKNPAVKNVTGKPKNKAGMLQKHMFATPHADLAKTAIGINSKQDSLRGSQNSLDSIKAKDDSLAPKPILPSIGAGENASPSRSPSPIKQSVKQSISRTGSGEKRRMSIGTEDVVVPPEDTVKSRSDKRSSKRIVKKTGKEMRKKRVSKNQEVESTKTGSRSDDRISEDVVGVSDVVNGDDVEKPGTPTTAAPIHDTVGTYHDIIRAAEATMSKTSCDELDSITSPTKSSSLLGKFSKFRLNVSPDSSPSAKEQANSYRMTYSTLPSFGAKASQSTAPATMVDDDARKKVEVKPSNSKSIPFDFEDVEKGYEIRARRTPSTRTLRSKKSSKSGLRSRQSGSMTSSSSQASSASRGVMESVSDVWKRHKDEMTNLQKCVELGTRLPLTSAFTFSFFPLSTAHVAHNRLVFERAAAIKQLRKPIEFNKSRGAAKIKKVVPINKVTPVKSA